MSSSSTLSACCRGNAIDKPQSEVIRQHLSNYEESAADAPLTWLVTKGKAWMSGMLDCHLCCVDTTTVTPLAVEGGGGGVSPVLGGGGGGGGKMIIRNDETVTKLNKNFNYCSSSSSPNTETLRNRGIGGLSFEIESCSGLSYERGAY